MGAKIPPLVTPFALVSLVLALGATNVVVNKATHTSEGAKVTSVSTSRQFQQSGDVESNQSSRNSQSDRDDNDESASNSSTTRTSNSNNTTDDTGTLINLHGQQEILAQKHRQIDQQIQTKVRVLIETVPHNRLVQQLTIIQRHKTRLVVILPERLRLNNKEAGY